MIARVVALKRFNHINASKYKMILRILILMVSSCVAVIRHVDFF